MTSRAVMMPYSEEEMAILRARTRNVNDVKEALYEHVIKGNPMPEETYAKIQCILIGASMLADACSSIVDNGHANAGWIRNELRSLQYTFNLGIKTDER